MNVYQKKLNKFTKTKIRIHSKTWENIGFKWSYRIVRNDTRWRHKKDLLSLQ